MSLGADYAYDLAWLLNEQPVERDDPWRYANRPRKLTQIAKLLPKIDSEASTIHPFELLCEYVMRTASAQRASIVSVCSHGGFKYMQLVDGRNFAEREGVIWTKGAKR